MPCFPKPGVTFEGLVSGGKRIRQALDTLADTQKTAVMVTCTTDSHGPTDPHSQGRAIDVRTIGWTPTNTVTYIVALRANLGPEFTVLYEVPLRPKDPILAKIAYVNPKATGSHLHIQVSIPHAHDPKWNVKE